MFTANAGLLSDGSGSNNYPNNADCEWIIAPPGAQKVVLTFTLVDTERDYDLIAVFRCTDTSCSYRTELAEFSGYITSNPSYTSDTGIMLVTLYSDSDVTSAGFSASWNTFLVCVCFPCRAYYDGYLLWSAFAHTLMFGCKCIPWHKTEDSSLQCPLNPMLIEATSLDHIIS